MSSGPPPSPSLDTHPEVPDGIVPAARPAEPPAGSLAPVPGWAPLAAMIVAFVFATIAYLLLAAIVEAGGGNVTSGGPPGLVISATLVQDIALIVAAVGFAGMWARGLTPASFGLRPTQPRSAAGWMVL